MAKRSMHLRTRLLMCKVVEVLCINVVPDWRNALESMIKIYKTCHVDRYLAIWLILYRYQMIEEYLDIQLEPNYVGRFGCDHRLCSRATTTGNNRTHHLNY